MTNRPVTLTTIVLVTLTLGCMTRAEPPATDAATARQKIEAGNAGLIAAVERGDSMAAASFYDDSAMAMPPGGDAAVGHANLVKLFGSFAGVTVTNMQLKVRDVAASGDLASETGHFEWTLTAKQAGAKPMTETGKYVVVWKRQADGSYRLFRDIWNADAPPAPPKK